MFKAILFAALLALAVAAPEPKAKPGLVAAYTAPVVSAPYAYSPYAAPYAYSAYSAYPAYSAYTAYPYSAPLVYA
ncbi:hypothetical protein QE152_g13967 [Popillia japonica]|uniref:Neuropeptide-like 4 n=1 Tax=Popillia japonica TaxID=7064 RepID=A0AAW1LBD9_POPJA